MDLQEQISAIGSTSEPEATSAEPAQPEAEGQQPAQNPEPATPEAPDPLKEVELLKRVIATDPNMRDRYVAEKLGIPQAPPQYLPQPQYQPQYQQQPPQAPALPWNDENPFDPTNAEHFQAALDLKLNQALAPAMQFIQQQQQQNQSFQQQQQQARIGELENQTRSAMDQHLPGFAQMAQALDTRTATPEQEMLLNFTYNRFTEEMHRNYNEAHWHHPTVQQEVIRSIAPTIKSLADRLGVLSPAPQTPPAAAPPRTFVESSMPVPQASASKFDDAYKKKDFTTMISAIGRTT